MTDNPFKGPCYNGQQLYHLAVDDRLRMVKDFDTEQCTAALQVPGLQKTVGSAIKTRISKLIKAAA